MIHPHTTLKYISPERGYGVVATAFIPKGTIIYVTDPLEIFIPPDSPLLEHPTMGPIIAKFAIVEADGRRMISWDIAKHVNHCCHPNTLTTGFGFEIAIQDIHQNEEITDEYGMFNYSPGMRLVCHYSDCRQCLRSDDLARFYPQWDEIAKDAMSLIQQRPQPLFSFMDEETYNALCYYLQTGKGFKSASVYLQPTKE